MSRTLLIIDDDRELCELVGELLRGEGFDVESPTTTLRSRQGQAWLDQVVLPRQADRSWRRTVFLGFRPGLAPRKRPFASVV